MRVHCIFHWGWGFRVFFRPGSVIQGCYYDNIMDFTVRFRIFVNSCKINPPQWISFLSSSLSCTDDKKFTNKLIVGNWTKFYCHVIFTRILYLNCFLFFHSGLSFYEVVPTNPYQRGRSYQYKCKCKLCDLITNLLKHGHHPWLCFAGLSPSHFIERWVIKVLI